MKRIVELVSIVFGILVMAASVAGAQEVPFKSELPMLVTSSGQALDALTASTMLKRVGVEHVFNTLATAEDLEGINTLVIAIGVSVKGFGAAGITADTERARTEALIAGARERGIPIIGIHIGGDDQRGGQSEVFVQLVSPLVDYLIVWANGDQDGYFEKVAEEKGIPLTVIKLPIDIGQVLADVVK